MFWGSVCCRTVPHDFLLFSYSGTPDSVSVFQMEAASAARLGLAVFTYDLKAVDVHLPVSWMSLSEHPALAIIVASPALKLCDVKDPSERSTFPFRRCFRSSLYSLSHHLLLRVVVLWSWLTCYFRIWCMRSRRTTTLEDLLSRICPFGPHVLTCPLWGSFGAMLLPSS